LRDPLSRLSKRGIKVVDAAAVFQFGVRRENCDFRHDRRAGFVHQVVSRVEDCRHAGVVEVLNVLPDVRNFHGWIDISEKAPRPLRSVRPADTLDLRRVLIAIGQSDIRKKSSVHYHPDGFSSEPWRTPSMSRNKCAAGDPIARGPATTIASIVNIQNTAFFLIHLIQGIRAQIAAEGLS